MEHWRMKWSILETSFKVQLYSSGLIIGLLLSTVDLSYGLSNQLLYEASKNFTSLYACPELESDKVTTLSISSVWTKSGKDLTFSLKSGFGSCSAGSFVLSMDLANNSSTDSHNPDNEYIDVNGVLRLGKDFYHPYEYCVYEVRNEGLKLRICNATCEGITPCISKCCSIGKLIDYVNQEGCVDHASDAFAEWRPKLYENPHDEVSSSEFFLIKPHIIQNPPKCTFPNGTLDPESEFETLPSVDVPQFQLSKMLMRLRRDGSLLYLGTDRSWEILPWDSFCIDYILVDENKIEANASGTFLVSSSRPLLPVVVLKCVQNFEKTGRLSLFYVVAMFISAFFLMLTGSVYAMLWDRHNIHGWTILCHVMSMFFLYVFLGISHTFGLIYESDYFLESTSCLVIGVTVHFFFVSTFCWLTLINFDLWSTFRSLTPVGERSKGVKRFVLYNIFAWGIATIVVTVGVTMDHLYQETYSEVIVPKYGRTNCFMAPWAMGYYVYSIIGALMIINFGFIFLTLCTIYKFRETTRMIQHSKSGGSIQSFKLFSKLFIIMGVTWVLEIVSWLTIGKRTTLHWTLLDCVNIFQAIAVFVIFICKRKTVVQLQQKFPLCNKTWSCCDQTVSDTPKTSNSTDHSTETTGTNSKQSSVSKRTIQMRNIRSN